MDAESYAWLTLVTALVTWLAAIGSKSLRGFLRHELKEVCTRWNNLDRLGHILRSHDRVALSVEGVQMLATAAFLWAALGWLRNIEGDVAGWQWALSEIALTGLALLVLASWLPWTLVGLWESHLLFFLWPLWVAVHALFSPLAFIARFFDTVAHRLAGRERIKQTEETFEEEIRTVVSEGHREGLLKEEEREMIEGIIELGESDVSEIMTPRTDITGMPITMTLNEAAEFVSESSHTRLPVFDKNRDNIVGILHAKDLLSALAAESKNGSPPTLKTILREPYFIPETKPVNLLLREFQQTRNQLAIVLDEYGGVSGLVTIEDVLEEIVGEIVDEYDEDLVEEIKEVDAQTAEALARVHVDEINERLGIELPEDGDYDTIGGFVFHELGHVPKVGEEVVWKNVRFTVLDATKRRVERLRIEILDPSWQEETA